MNHDADYEEIFRKKRGAIKAKYPSLKTLPLPQRILAYLFAPKIVCKELWQTTSMEPPTNRIVCSQTYTLAFWRGREYFRGFGGKE